MPLKNIRVKEAAAYVGLSKSSLDKLRCFGGGPGSISWAGAWFTTPRTWMLG